MSFRVGSIYGELILTTAKWDRAMSGVERRQRSFQERINRTNASLRRMGIAMTAIGVAIGGVIHKAVNEFAVFEKAMRHATSVSEVTNEQFRQMSVMAEDAAIRWNKSAREAGSAFYYLGSAGLKAGEQIASFNNVLMLSRAVGDEVVNVARGVVDVTKAFGLSFTESAHTADILTQTVITSNQVFKDLTDSMRYGSAVARETNNTLAETTAAFGIMANAGIRGSMAGTVFRRALTNLMGPSAQMKEIMRDLTVNIYDSTGAMKPFIEILGEINTSLKGTTQKYKNMVFEVLFGRRAIAGMLNIFNFGAEAMRAYADSIENAGSATRRVAEKQMKAFAERSGQVWQELKKLTRHIAATLIPTLQELFSYLQPKIAIFTEWVDINNQLVGTITKVTAGVAALSVGIGGFLIVLPFVIKGLATMIFFVGKLLLPIALLQAATYALSVAWDKDWFGMQKTVERWDKSVTGTIRYSIHGWKLMYTTFFDWFDKFKLKTDIWSIASRAPKKPVGFNMDEFWNWIGTTDYKSKLVFIKDISDAYKEGVISVEDSLKRLNTVMISSTDVLLQWDTFATGPALSTATKVEGVFKSLLSGLLEGITIEYNALRDLIKLNYPELFAALEELMAKFKRIGEISTQPDAGMPALEASTERATITIYKITGAADKFKATWDSSLIFVTNEFSSMGKIMSNVLADLKNSFADLMEDWIDQTTGLRDTMTNLFAAIRAAFIRLVAEAAAQDLFGAMFGAKGEEKGGLAGLIQPLWNAIFKGSTWGATTSSKDYTITPLEYDTIADAHIDELRSEDVPKIAPPQGGQIAPKIAVTIVNNSGVPVSMSGEEPYFDGVGWVMSMVMEGLDTTPQFRNALGATT